LRGEELNLNLFSEIINNRVIKMNPEFSIYGGINPTGELSSNHFTLSYISSINNSSFEESYSIPEYFSSSLNKSADERTKNFEEEFFTKHGSEIFSGTDFTYVNGKIKYIGKRTEEDFEAARDKLWNNVEELWAKRYSSDEESLDAIEHLVYSNMVVPKIKIEEKTFGEKVKTLGKKIKNYFTGQDTQAIEANPGVYQTAAPGAEINVNLPNPPITREKYLTPSKATKKKWSKGKKIGVGLVTIGTIVGLGIAGTYLVSQNNANPFAGEKVITGKMILYGGEWSVGSGSLVYFKNPYTDKTDSAKIVVGSPECLILYNDPIIDLHVKEFKAIGKDVSEVGPSPDKIKPVTEVEVFYARLIEILNTRGQQSEKSTNLFPSLDPINSSLCPTTADLHPSTPEPTELTNLPQELKVVERKEFIDPNALSRQLAKASA